jgi:hypothetical protein
MVKDIREIAAEDYWDELRQRWGALLSYRYIGRQFASMNNVEDNAVLLRHDMRNAAGGVMAAPLAITCPTPGGGKSDLEAVPNPVIHSIQILDDARDVQRIEVVRVTNLRGGRTMGFGRAIIVDADNNDRVIALVQCQVASIGEVPPGLPKFDDDPTCRRCGRSLARAGARTGIGSFPNFDPSSLRLTRRCISGRSTSFSRPQP